MSAAAASASLAAGLGLFCCGRTGAKLRDQVAQPETGVVGVRLVVTLEAGEAAAVVITAEPNAVPGVNDWVVEREVELSHPPPLLGP